MSGKDWFKVALLMLGFYAVAPYVLGLILSLRYPTTMVDYDTPVVGRVTGTFMNRQLYLHHLNGDRWAYYNFNTFVPETASPQTDGLSQDSITRLILSPRLREGDSIWKAAHSTRLSVWRGRHVTRWICPAD